VFKIIKKNDNSAQEQIKVYGIIGQSYFLIYEKEKWILVNMQDYKPAIEDILK